jgi:hypothetical protein
LKKLKIYKNDEGEFVLERINEFAHGTKRFFISEEGLLEALDGYEDLSGYEIEVSAESDLWSKIINYINR